MAKIPLFGRGVRERQESLRQAAAAKVKSAEDLRRAESLSAEGARLEATLSYVRRANHFAERFGSALRGNASDGS